MRIIACIGIKVDNVHITGDRMLQMIKTELSCDDKGANIVYAGSECVEGAGIGMVIRIGENVLLSKTSENNECILF